MKREQEANLLQAKTMSTRRVEGRSDFDEADGTINIGCLVLYVDIFPAMLENCEGN